MKRRGGDTGDGGAPPAEPEGKRRLRRRRRAPSSIAGADGGGGSDADADDDGSTGDGADGSTGDGDQPLSRAERRRQKHAASDRAREDRQRELSDRQRKLLGLPDPVADSVDLPITRPPPEARRPPVWQRHDLLVAVVGLALFVAGAIAHAALTAPVLEPFARHGLSLERPAGWLPPVPLPAPPLRLAADAPLDDGAPAGDPPYHVLFASPLDPLVAIEVRIAPRAGGDDTRVALALARAARHGEAYWAAEGENHTIAGHDWQRTRYRYATKLGRSSAPRLATGIEYAGSHGGLDYVVTFHGGEADALRLESLIAPTLAIALPGGGP